MKERKSEEHIKAQGDICGVTMISDGGIEWICVKKPHNPSYRRKKGDRTHRKGSWVEGTGGHLDGPYRGFSVPQADRHYFVNRWPNRPAREDI